MVCNLAVFGEIVLSLVLVISLKGFLLLKWDMCRVLPFLQQIRTLW